MDKIATTSQLQRELQRLLDYTESHQPSRARLASALRHLSQRLMPTHERALLRNATDFPSPEALRSYLKDHPNADVKKHHVVKNKGTDQESRSSGGHSVKVKLPKDLASAIKSDWHGSRFDRPGNPVSGVMNGIEKGQDVPLNRLQKAILVLRGTENHSEATPEEKKKLRGLRKKLQEHSRTVQASELHALSTRAATTVWRSWGNAGEWYVQRVRDQEIYFKASGEEIKNGNISGTQVTLQLDRPRARPKAKQISVSRTNQGLWKRVDATDVPPAVVSAAG